MNVNVFLNTERMILRRFTEADADLLIALDADPEVMRHITAGRPTAPDEIRQQWLPQVIQQYEREQGLGFWAAIRRHDREFLGWFHLRPTGQRDQLEIGYRLKRSAWGQGYATEGCRGLVHKALFEQGARQVVASALTANAASIRVMEKAGMKFQTTFLETRFPGLDQRAIRYYVDRSLLETARRVYPAAA